MKTMSEKDQYFEAVEKEIELFLLAVRERAEETNPSEADKERMYEEARQIAEDIRQSAEKRWNERQR
jgi:hypothetical protein